MSRHKQVLAPTRHWRLLSRHNVNTLGWSRSCLSVCVRWQYSWPCLLLTTQRNQWQNKHSDTNTVHWLHSSWLVRPGEVNQDDVCRTCNVLEQRIMVCKQYCTWKWFFVYWLSMWQATVVALPYCPPQLALEQRPSKQRTPSSLNVVRDAFVETVLFLYFNHRIDYSWQHSTWNHKNA